MAKQILYAVSLRGVTDLLSSRDANVSTSYNEATIRACRLVRHAVSLRGVSYSREVARFALFGGRLPKVKVLTADVPINVICVVLWVGRVFLRLQNKKRYDNYRIIR